MLHSAENIMDHYLKNPNADASEDINGMPDPAALHDGPTIEDMAEMMGQTDCPFSPRLFLLRQRQTRY